MVEPHTERPATAEDSSAVQAGTYSELVNTVLFFVSQGTEKGLIQLTDDYDGDVEEDLNRACLEVAKDDPLGAYAVDFIKNDCTKVLTTYEATITISYRRTREQIRSLVNVTGTSAIRDEVRAALADFQSEVALRWATSLRAPTPLPPWCGRPTTTSPPAPWACRSLPSPSTPPPAGSSALWRSCSPIPRTPRRCVKRAMTSRARQMPWCSLSGPISSPPPPGRPSSFPWFGSTSAPGRTAAPPPGTPCWAHGADSEGLALTFQLLSGKMEVGSVLVEGTLNGEPHFWNQLTADGGAHYVDLTRDASGTTYSAADLLSLGYVLGGRGRKMQKNLELSPLTAAERFAII